jgi:type IV secretory pathway VirB3-like protein
MSIQQRRNIAYWFLLIAGIALISMQIYKYFIGTLILSVEELIVCLVATTLVVSPKLILESIEKFINSKYGNKNES